MHIAGRQSPDSPQSGDGSHRVVEQEQINLTDDSIWCSSAKIGAANRNGPW